MNRDIMNELIAKYQAGDGAASLVLEVAVRNAIDLAYARDRIEQEGEYEFAPESEDYYQFRQQLDEEIDDCLPSMHELKLLPTFMKERASK